MYMVVVVVVVVVTSRPRDWGMGSGGPRAQSEFLPPWQSSWSSNRPKPLQTNGRAWGTRLGLHVISEAQSRTQLAIRPRKEHERGVDGGSGNDIIFWTIADDTTEYAHDYADRHRRAAG